VVGGDRRATVDPAATVNLRNGERGKAVDVNPYLSAAFQATVSDDGKSIQLHIRARGKDGTETIPEMETEVPIGSVFVAQCLTGRLIPKDNAWDFVRQFLGEDYSPQFLMVTPYVASERQEEIPTAAR
jgi:hypothetical protein